METTPKTAYYWQGRLCQLLSEQDPDVAASTLSEWLAQASPQERFWIQDGLNDVYWCFDDTNSPALRSIFDAARREVLQLEARDAILQAHQGNLVGVVLRRTGREQGVLFLPDASHPGKFRYSEFDPRGFYSHSTFASYKEALEDAWQHGFRESMTQDWFVSLSSTDLWREGAEELRRVDEHNQLSARRALR